VWCPKLEIDHKIILQGFVFLQISKGSEVKL
jgi:hypothetical protein